MNVRPATPDDLPALLALYVQLNVGNAGADRTRAGGALEAIFAREGMHLLVAEAGAAVIGTVTLVIVPNLTHDAQPWGQIENMVTDASVRGSGAGRLLIEACLGLARAAGCYKVQLQSANTRATPETMPTASTATSGSRTQAQASASTWAISL